MRTPAMPADIASIRARKRLTFFVLSGVASSAMVVRNAFRRTSQRLMPSTPSR